MTLFGYDIDTNAVARGAFISTAIVIPLAIVIGRVVEDDSNWQVPLTIALLAAFAVGGAVAGRRAPRTPAVHGALTAVPCLALVTIWAIGSRLFGDGDATIALIGTQIIIATSLGMLGGAAASRFANRPTPLTG